MTKGNQKKKVVVTTKKNIEPTKSKLQSISKNQPQKTSLSFGRKNYIYLLSGIGLIILGLILMSGGHMPSDDVWDENLIYSTRRTLIAPIVIIGGLILEIFAIFK